MLGVKGGTPTTLNCDATAWVENERFSFRGSSNEGTEAKRAFSIESTERRARVKPQEDLELPGAKGKIICALFLKNAKTKSIEESLQMLKKLVETD